MIGIVVVSHSPQLAEAAVGLALQMVSGVPPTIELAAGAGEGVIGTDAVRVSEAITAAASPDGVLVFTDLGSAVLSAEMALEFADVGEMPVRLSSAPFVEGLLAAVVLAAAGASLDEVDREARAALGAKRAQLGADDQDGASSDSARENVHAPGAAVAAAPGAPTARTQARLVNPAGMHARPAGMIMGAMAGLRATVRVAKGDAAAVALTGPTALLTLGARAGDTLAFEAEGPDADAALARIGALVEDGFGELAGGAGTLAAEAAGQAAGAEPASGARPTTRQEPRGQSGRGHPLGVSPGRAAAAVVHLAAPLGEPPVVPPLLEGDRLAEADRVSAAFAAVANSYRARALAAGPDDPPGVSDGLAAPRKHGRPRAGSHAAAILEATAALAEDAGIITAARARVREEGDSAPRAVWQAVGAVVASLIAAGGRTAERASDLRDVRDRALARLAGVAEPGVPGRDAPFILVARDLAPADTAALDPATCVAIVTAEGGPTSHTAILARDLGIPAVAAAPEALDFPEGAMLFVDGGSGRLVLDPDEAVIASVARPDTVYEFGGAGSTADGHPVALLANVGSGEDVPRALAAHAEGVGLFRTEFCFLGRQEAPDIDEQVAAYRAVFAGFAGRKVVVRTLDAGADKPLPFVTAAHEDNPALGVRGYRTSWRRPEVLEDQLTAIARAAALEGAQVQVMAPMIATVEEAAEFARRARGHGLSQVGVMVETPAAALTAAELFEVVDFVSLGTNDLAQYTMAADRLSGELAVLNDPWQPAVLRLIAQVGDAGAAAGKPVGVCGEAASDPGLAPVLVGLGVTSLSMTPRAIATVAERLAGAGLAACRTAAQAALAAADPASARAAASAALA